MQGEIKAAGAGYRAAREARVRKSGAFYQRGAVMKLLEHQLCYP
nr:hypothetical protein [Candidatus Hamiltonella defensa]